MLGGVVVDSAATLGALHAVVQVRAASKVIGRQPGQRHGGRGATRYPHLTRGRGRLCDVTQEQNDIMTRATEAREVSDSDGGNPTTLQRFSKTSFFGCLSIVKRF